MTIQSKLTELQQLCDAASEAPWGIHLRNPFSIECEVGILNMTGGTLFRSTSYGKMRDDGWWIVGARTAMPQLVQALRQSLKHVEEEDVCVCDSSHQYTCTRCEFFTRIASILEVER